MPRRVTPDVERLWNGLPVFKSDAAARRQADMYPWLGGFIAMIVIPDSSPVRYERTTRTAGHYTIWGEPTTLLALVQSVVPVAAHL